MNPRRRRRNRKGRVRYRRWLNDSGQRFLNERYFSLMASSLFLRGTFPIKVTEHYYSPSVEDFIEMKLERDE